MALGLVTAAYPYDTFTGLDGTLLWDDGGNWSGGLPNSSTDVFIGYRLSSVVLNGNGYAQDFNLYSGGLNVFGTLSVSGNFSADNQIVQNNSIGIEALNTGVINIGTIGGDPTLAANSVVFGANSFGPVPDLIATAGGQINVNASAFDYYGSGGLESGYGYPYWSQALAADGAGSQINILAESATISGGYGANSGVLSVTAGTLAGALSAINSGTVNAEATLSYSGSIFASNGGTLSLYSALNGVGPSSNGTSVYNDAAVTTESGGQAFSSMGSYGGSLTMNATGNGTFTYSWIGGTTVDVTTADLSSELAGGQVGVSANNLTIENSAGNSYIQAQSGAVVNLEGGNTTVDASSAGQNVFLSFGANSQIYLSGWNQLLIDPADVNTNNFAGGIFFIPEGGGTISLQSPNTVIGANSYVEMVGLGSTFDINAMPTGSEQVYFDGYINAGTTSDTSVLLGTSYVNINGGSVTFGQNSYVYDPSGFGIVISVNNLDNASLKATNLGTFDIFSGGTLNVGGASFTNDGTIQLYGATASFGQSAPGVSNVTPMVVTNDNQIYAQGGSTIWLSGQLTNNGSFTISDTSTLNGDSNSAITNSASGNVEFNGSFSGPAGASQIGSFDNAGGNLTIQGGAMLTAGSFTNEQAGTALVTGGGQLSATGTLSALSGATMYLYDEQVSYGGAPPVDYGGGRVTAGTLTVSDGFISVDAESVLSAGSATVFATNPTSYSGPGDFDSSGGVTAQNGGKFNVTNGDLTLQGYGYVGSGLGGAVTVSNGNVQLHDESSIWVQGGGSMGASFTVSNGNLVLHDDSSFVGGYLSQTSVATGNVYAHDNSGVSLYPFATMTVGGNYVNRDYASLQVGVSSLNVNGNFINRDGAYVSVTGNGGAGFTGITVGGNYVDNSTSGTYIAQGAALNVTKSLIVGQSGSVFATDAGTTVTVSTGHFTNNGSVNVVNGANVSTTVGDYNNSNNGSTFVDSSSSLNVGGNYNQTGSGSYTQVGDSISTNQSLNVAGNYNQSGGLTKVYSELTATALNLSGGTLGGAGTINANVNNTGGTVDVGDPQILTINGNYTQGSGGTLILDIYGTGGPGQPNGWDQLNVSGNLNLGGTLDLVFGNGYSPTGGASFNVLNFGSLTGSFSNFEETINGTTFNVSPTILSLNGGVGNITPAATPEPSSVAALGFGILALLRRRKGAIKLKGRGIE